MARGQGREAGAGWNRPLSITTTPSSRVVWKSTVSLSPCRHIDTVSDSPGSTGRLKRPDIDRNLAGSEPASKAVADARNKGVTDPGQLFETGARAFLHGSWQRR